MSQDRDGCARCAEALDPAAAPLMLCEACLGRHHAACWTSGCGLCGETRGLGPIGPLSRPSPARLDARPRPRRATRRLVALGALGVVVGTVAVCRSRFELADQGPIADWTRVIEQEPLNAEAWLHRGYERERAGDHSGAIADFTHIVSTLDPAHATAWNNRAFARGRSGDHVGAVDDATRAIELAPRFAYAWNNRGYSRMCLGDPVAAMADVGRSLELDPSNEYAWENRGRLRLLRGDRPGAIADFRTALEVDARGERTDAIRAALADASR